MSGIFDKYLNMINGSKSTYGQLSTQANVNRSVTTMSGKDSYIPYKKIRRSSSTASTVSDSELSVSDQVRRKSSTGSVDMTNLPEIEKQMKRVISEPNNRVNF